MRTPNLATSDSNRGVLSPTPPHRCSHKGRTTPGVLVIREGFLSEVGREEGGQEKGSLAKGSGVRGAEAAGTLKADRRAGAETGHRRI